MTAHGLATAKHHATRPDDDEALGGTENGVHRPGGERCAAESDDFGGESAGHLGKVNDSGAERVDGRYTDGRRLDLP